jgi:hypothetical protein
MTEKTMEEILQTEIDFKEDFIYEIKNINNKIVIFGREKMKQGRKKQE